MFGGQPLTGRAVSAVGDMVWAANPVTGEAGPEQVVATILGHGTKTLVEITTNTATVVATGGHPFWVTNQHRWTGAQDIQPGDHLLNQHGNTIVVDQIAITQAANQTVHNLTITNHHTYAVGPNHDAILTHNCNAPNTAPGFIEPGDVRVSQADASLNFSNGGNVSGLSAGLRSGAIDPSDVPPIRLAEIDGQFFTLDNRRSIAFGDAGVPVPYRMATPDEIAAEAFKFTTTNGGTSIQLRLFSPFRYQGGPR